MASKSLSYKEIKNDADFIHSFHSFLKNAKTSWSEFYSSTSGSGQQSNSLQTD